jgi:hypothetical protein
MSEKGSWQKHSRHHHHAPKADAAFDQESNEDQDRTENLDLEGPKWAINCRLKQCGVEEQLEGRGRFSVADPIYRCDYQNGRENNLKNRPNKKSIETVVVGLVRLFSSDNRRTNPLNTKKRTTAPWPLNKT